MKQFRIWVQNVLPVVYDDSLSYYEVLCKCVDYINNLLKTDSEIFDDIDGIRADLKTVQDWINNYNTSFAEEVIAECIATSVFFGLSDDGYFIAYMPESWDDISFETSGYDAPDLEGYDYGHLCIKY